MILNMSLYKLAYQSSSHCTNCCIVVNYKQTLLIKNYMPVITSQYLVSIPSEWHTIHTSSYKLLFLEKYMNWNYIVKRTNSIPHMSRYRFSKSNTSMDSLTGSYSKWFVYFSKILQLAVKVALGDPTVPVRIIDYTYIT